MDHRGRFETLYALHAGAVRTYAARRSDLAGADDVVAEVFLVAWRRLDVVPEDALPWLLATARRVLANQRRTTGRQAALHDRLAADRSAPDSGEPAGDQVIDALGTLSEVDREVLLLSAWEDLEPARAAKVLGIRKGTYAMRLSRARKRLAIALDTQPLPTTRPSTEVLP